MRSTRAQPEAVGVHDVRFLAGCIGRDRCAGNVRRDAVALSWGESWRMVELNGIEPSTS